MAAVYKEATGAVKHGGWELQKTEGQNATEIQGHYVGGWYHCRPAGHELGKAYVRMPDVSSLLGYVRVRISRSFAPPVHAHH